MRPRSFVPASSIPRSTAFRQSITLIILAIATNRSDYSGCRDYDNDQFPIFADWPQRSEHSTIPINHRKGQNVLFAGGHVRFCTNPFVGPETEGRGDDIHYNTAFQTHAGTNHWDIALGCASETP